MPTAPACDVTSRSAWDPRRWILAGLGVVSVALGAIGAVVPGMPTTVFLIVASFCFTRSCPWLEERLLRTRLFAPYMKMIDAREPMPRRARLTIIAIMWVSVSVSLWALAAAGRLAAWGVALILLAAVAGTVSISLHARPRQKPSVLPG